MSNQFYHTFKDDHILNKMKDMAPAAIDIEIRQMSIEMGGTEELLNKFLKFIYYVLSTYKNFELANSYLGLFMKVSIFQTFKFNK